MDPPYEAPENVEVHVETARCRRNRQPKPSSRRCGVIAGPNRFSGGRIEYYWGDSEKFMKPPRMRRC
ncbi:MAG TPA: hypothetical protein VGB27_05345 [Candidatus Binatia bacterium]